MERRYTEQEVTEIIRRAAERQMEERTGEVPATAGVTESELKRIAGELGISSSSIDGALSEIGTVSASESGGIQKMERTLERVVLGEVDQEAYGSVLEQFVPAPGTQGQAVQVGRSLNYTSMVGLGTCTLSISQRAGRTTLKVKSEVWLPVVISVAFALVSGLVTGAGIWESRSLGAPEKSVLTALMLVALAGIGWAFTRWATRYTNRKVEHLTDDAARGLAETAEQLRSNLSRPLVPELEAGLHGEQAHIQ